MRRFVVSAASLLLCAGAAAQGSPSASQFVASRQLEVERMAEIFYNTRLDNGTWTQHDLPECGTFSHHAFVRFDGVPVKVAPTSFLAIYDLTHPPARSSDKPWQGGVTLVRVPPHQEGRQDAGPSPDYLIAALNRALKQERAASAGRQPSAVPDARSTARCFVSISGNAIDTSASDDQPVAAPDGPSLPIVNTLVPLTGKPGFARTQSISFDRDGSILAAEISVTPK